MDEKHTRGSADWLLGDGARSWIAEATASPLPVHQQVAKLRAQLTMQQVHDVLELVELRRRGAQKFSKAAAMFFTRLGFEQSTDQWIASYKARRFADRRVADLCCGIGGDAIGLAQVANELLLCDRAPLAVQMAQRNLAAYHGGSLDHVRLAVADVLQVDLSDFDAWHIDPDRRPGGGRTSHAELHEPSDVVIDRLLTKNQNAAIKLAPACEVPPRWEHASELEWVSRDGECKQLVAWQGELALAPGERRATMLQSDGATCQVLRTMVGRETPLVHNDALGPVVFEPDAAVLASGLVGSLAAEHGWWTFASTSGYLAGAAPVDEPAAAAFRVIDVLPLHVKKLSQYLRERGIGKLEIKHRSIDVAPDRLRRELKLVGNHHATLLLTRVGEKRIAIVSDRIDPHESARATELGSIEIE